MLYATELYALNWHLPEDPTSGDWHPHYLQRPPTILDTDNSPIKDWHVYQLKEPIITDDGTTIEHIADHARACLDLMSRGYPIPHLQREILDNEHITREIIQAASIICDAYPNIPLDSLMQKEYKADWILYRRYRRQI